MVRPHYHWLWRAVDQDGYELDILLQNCHNKKAAHLIRDNLRAAFQCWDEVVLQNQFI